MGVRRVTLSLPEELAADLTYVHKRMNISKSALVSSMIADAIHDFRQLVESLPPEPDTEDVKRFRGKSADLILHRVASLQSELIRGTLDVDEN